MITLKKEQPLNIYRASAGSGKTHLLTGFYLKQLFLPTELPDASNTELRFSEILAVTFTNKATAEMKGRIIQDLYLLSVNPQKSHYWEDVNPEGSKTPEQISKKAKELLVQILNDYASFNISTIDSFFQKVVRSFARELNVSGNYEIEMDLDKTLDATLSNFLDKLDERKQKETFDWLVEFSENRNEEGAGWDFREPLLKMAKRALSSEEYRNHSQQIKEFTQNKKALHAYENLLRSIRKEWREDIKRLGQDGLNTLERYGLQVRDFSRSFPSRLADWANYESGKIPEPTSTFINAAENPDTWFTKKSQYAKGLNPDAETAIKDVFARCVGHFTGKPFRDYCTATAIARNLYELGIMANIDEELKAYCDEQNMMMLSSTNELLSRLIGPDDAPFIYEKTGTRIKSYMIDEFQDTSGMQWGNFVPLIDNSLGQGYQNLIVGDVKQSIYRWRGSDWGLLDSQLNLYHPKMHFEDPEALKVNWRSLDSIVDFNNHFFQTASEQLDSLAGTKQISRIYRDLEQELPDNLKNDPSAPKGLVSIEFLECHDEEGNVIEKPNAEQKEAESMRRLPEQIIRLMDLGFRPKDIAILCRRKAECSKVAQTLLKYKQENPNSTYKMDIISNEALLISSRTSVQTVINVMRHLQTPESNIQCMVAYTGFFQLEGASPSKALDQYFSMTPEGQIFDKMLAHHPLYEMTEQIIGKLPQPVQQLDAPFLQAFRDQVLSFSGTQGSDLTSFLQWWDQSGCTQSISTPDGQDAIQILTIHKSKGLGMPAIILPYASWEMDLDSSHSEVFWCQPKEEPFTQDILLPVKLDKSLTSTIFAEEFAEERLRTVIDNLNTAYVAFTRAKEAMIIMTPKPKGKVGGSMLEDLLSDYCKLPQGETCLTKGDSRRREQEEQSHAATSQEDSVVTCGEDFLFLETTPLPKVKVLHSPLLPDVTAKDKGTYIHRVLQEIRTLDGAASSIHSLYLRGIINPEIISETEMQQVISQLLSNPQVQPWFASDLTILNEQSITDSKGNLQRLDRLVITPQGRAIVIDYKTGHYNKEYRSQIKGYMEALRQIGYSNVEGYLLFIKDGKVMKV